MSTLTPPACAHALRWTASNHGRDTLGALTGQDRAAFLAISHLVELWQIGDANGKQAAVAALHATLGAMQSKTRALAFHALEAADEWVARDLWPLIKDVAPGTTPAVEAGQTMQGTAR